MSQEEGMIVISPVLLTVVLVGALLAGEVFFLNSTTQNELFSIKSQLQDLKEKSILTAQAVQQPQQQVAQQPEPQQPSVVNVNTQGKPVRGNANAKVTLVEYSDFECPFCKRFHDDAMKNVLKDYVETGKVKVVYKHFPLPFHPNAQKAAEAAECANDQGKFWEMHDKLFAMQEIAIDVASLKKYARELGLNPEKFDKCLDNSEKASAVQKDLDEGQLDGVSGTPTSFINGKAIVGAQPYAAIKAAIEAALAGG